MTAAFEFYAEQAFLSFVKHLLDDRASMQLDTDESVVAIVACAAALEAMVNRLFELQGALKEHQASPLKKKIAILAQTSKEEMDWDVSPWQDVAELIQLRNWLMHYKESWMGLVNSEGQWVRDHNGNLPRFTPAAFSKERIANYYQCVRSIVSSLANGLGHKGHFSYLQSETYEPYEQTG